MANHIDGAREAVPTEEQLLELQDTFNGIHHALQNLSKAYIEFSMAYVAVFDHIDNPKPDPAQLALEI